MINFLLDENIPFDIIQIIENKGHSVFHIKKLGKTGIKNGEVYKLASEKCMWIITRDTDFGSLINFNSYAIGGVILLRTFDTTVKNLSLVIFKIIDDFSNQLHIKRLITIFDDRITIYPEI